MNVKKIRAFHQKTKEAIREAENTGQKVNVKKSKIESDWLCVISMRVVKKGKKNAFSKLLRPIKMIFKFL